MLKNLLFVVASLFTVAASANQLQDQFSTALGRDLTLEEASNVNDIEQQLLNLKNNPQFANELTAGNDEVYRDERTVATWLGCLTVKGGFIFTASTQQLVCTNLSEVYTIAKSTGPGYNGTFNLSADVGAVIAWMGVTPSASARLQSFQLLDVPVDTIGIDGSYIFGGQIVVFSSPEVSLRMFGVLAGGGGNLTIEQNGNIPREEFQGSTLTIKKFNF